MVISVDVGIDKIIEVANEWFTKIVWAKKERQEKIAANILKSAGLLVFLIRTLNQSFIDILSEFYELSPGWPPEKQSTLLERLRKFAFGTKLIGNIDTYLGNLGSYPGTDGVSDETIAVVAKLVEYSTRFRDQTGRGAITGIDYKFLVGVMENPNKFEIIDGIKNNIEAMLTNNFDINNLLRLNRTFGQLIHQITSKYPNIPYPQWMESPVTGY